MVLYRSSRILNICCQLFCATQKRRATCKTLLCGFTVIFLIHWLIKFEQIREHGDFSDIPIEITDDFEPLGIDHVESFPFAGEPRIPRIIHQTWKDEMIPRKFEKWVKSWRRNHPDWDYILWTDESARELIKSKHPHLLPIFDGYPENIRRADALRYVVLYEYGGVYADMDLESLKSIVPMTLKYSCFLAQEPYEHPILDSNFEHLLINALMGCRKKHPFMKMVMDYLPSFSHMWNVLDSTGPHFLTFVYRQYMHGFNYPARHENGTYLAPAEYFFPTIDPAKYFHMRKLCSIVKDLSDIQVHACKNLKFKGVKRSNEFAFTVHHWIHTYLNIKLSLKGPFEITSLISNAQIYPHLELTSTR